MGEPIEMYLYELRHDDADRRIDAIRNLVKVVKELGPERVRDELIPYISDCLDDEEQVLMVFTEEIPKFVEFVGGNDFAYCLIPPLETLAHNEDSRVRANAVDGLISVAEALSESDVLIHLVPSLERLATADWHTPRTSACGLFAALYPKVPLDTQMVLKDSFLSLCNDVTPMVRRAAFTGMKDLVKVLPKAVILDEMLSIITEMSQDHQDSVRLLSIETCISLANVLSPVENSTVVRPIFMKSSTDSSWRVRYMVALHFHEAAVLLNSEHDAELVDTFLDLLQDEEPEVRKATASNITGMGTYLNAAAVIEKLLPCVNTLTTDPQVSVRESLALSITSLVEVLGAGDTKTHLLQLIESLLTDTQSVVRLNVISTLHKLLAIVDIEEVARIILDAIEHLSSDTQWRIRLKIIEYIPNMASQLGIQFFNTNLLALCLSWLNDSVFTVRMAAIENLKSLSVIFGEDWCLENIIPLINQFSHSDHFLERITSLFAIEKFIEVVNKNIRGDFYRIVVDKLDDNVPNVRFNACRILVQFEDEEVVPKLAQLLEDNDPDVRYHASQTLKKLL